MRRVVRELARSGRIRPLSQFSSAAASSTAPPTRTFFTFSSRQRGVATAAAADISNDAKVAIDAQLSTTSSEKEVLTDKLEAEKIVANAPSPGAARVFIVDDEVSAKHALSVLLSEKFADRPHAWDTETKGLDMSRSPIGRGESFSVICATCYAGEDVQFGPGKDRLFIEGDQLKHFEEYFGNIKYKKIFHNYSFDRHVMIAKGVGSLRGFFADTWHLARLEDSSLASWEGDVTSRGSRPGWHDRLHQKERHLVLKIGDYETPCGPPTSEETAINTKRQSGLHHTDESVPRSDYTLKYLASHHGLTEDGKPMRSYRSLSKIDVNNPRSKDLIEYATEDARQTFRLYNALHSILNERDWDTEIHRVSRGALCASPDLLEQVSKLGSNRAATLTGKPLWEFYNLYYRQFAEVLVRMEHRGMRLDKDHLARMKQKGEKMLHDCEALFREHLAALKLPDGTPVVSDPAAFNPASSKQLRQLLYGPLDEDKSTWFKNEMTCEHLEPRAFFKAPYTPGTDESDPQFVVRGLGLPWSQKYTDMTPGGWPSCSNETVAQLAGNPPKGKWGKQFDHMKTTLGEEQAENACLAMHYLVQSVKSRKLQESFLKPLLELAEGYDGRVHPSLTIDTATGRLACRKPNLQNIPTARGDPFELRRAFAASEGNVLLVADYSQLELRVLAHVTGCRAMIEHFEKGGDYHSGTAVDMYVFTFYESILLFCRSVLHLKSHICRSNNFFICLKKLQGIRRSEKLYARARSWWMHH